MAFDSRVTDVAIPRRKTSPVPNIVIRLDVSFPRSLTPFFTDFICPSFSIVLHCSPVVASPDFQRGGSAAHARNIQNRRNKCTFVSELVDNREDENIINANIYKISDILT